MIGGPPLRTCRSAEAPILVPFCGCHKQQHSIHATRLLLQVVSSGHHVPADFQLVNVGIDRRAEWGREGEEWGSNLAGRGQQQHCQNPIPPAVCTVGMEGGAAMPHQGPLKSTTAKLMRVQTTQALTTHWFWCLHTHRFSDGSSAFRRTPMECRYLTFCPHTTCHCILRLGLNLPAWFLLDLYQQISLCRSV